LSRNDWPHSSHLTRGFFDTGLAPPSSIAILPLVLIFGQILSIKKSMNKINLLCSVQSRVRSVSPRIHHRTDSSKMRLTAALLSTVPRSRQVFFFSKSQKPQCSGSGSESGSTGSTCFWASRIRILLSS